MKNWQWFIFWMFWLLALLGVFVLNIFHPTFNPQGFAIAWMVAGVFAGFGWFIEFMND